MTDPRQTIYEKLVELEGTFDDLKVYQGRPEVIENVTTEGGRAITFYISNNYPDYDLNKEVGRENVAVVVDIWAPTSSRASELLLALEPKMLELNYRLGLNSDILDPDGICHLTTQFIY